MRPVSFLMSPAKPLPIPTPPPARRPISSPRYLTTSLPHYFAVLPRHKNRDPFFSTACTLFSIQNSAHPLSFLNPTHSLPKTPGGSIGISNQIFSDQRPSNQISRLSKDCPVTLLESALPQNPTHHFANPIESIRFFGFSPILAQL